MIEITGNDINELSDSELRSLVGLLCEADLRANGIPTAGVTWGGHQNAKDGGIDVRVELTTSIHEDSFIPRSKTGFQVKKPDMPRGDILKEMRPNGDLRKVIKDLIDAKGAYIIVSSQGSTADSALADRKNAMVEALTDYPSASDLKVDFYDRERIAGWVRSHPSIILWVRDKIGRPIQGWSAYGNWARCPQGIGEEYYLDEHIRLHNRANHGEGGFSAVDGINEIRTILCCPRSSVRLVGLSGVGKTRLVQALFDERIGERPLNQSQVFYSDISDSPNPDPLNFAERLIALQKPAILVIDNCSPELHRRLTSVCSKSGSLVSLITVEYDVQEDQPEETEVFCLEPASKELIVNVICSRFRHVSEVNARTIAEFSGGNARIAIALANTIKKGDNLANLSDSELFSRLFYQNQREDDSLLKTGEVCSLVYSFNGEINGDELELLSSLINMSVNETYRNIAKLKRRDLIQQRNIWRAVLPHAVANRLAKSALENIPLDNLYNVFEREGSERMLKSFSRRLSFLHETEEAKIISNRWLSENGLLGDVSNLNELGINLLMNVAPIDPELTLSTIERVSTKEENQRFFTRENVHYLYFTRLLRSLAYDINLFERSVELLCNFALSESSDENNDSIRDMLKSLFYIYLSGTHATPEQRLGIITGLLGSDCEDKKALGISLLEAALESMHFTSHYEFEFGARSRDYGYSPATKEEIQKWFKLFINYTVNLGISDHPVSSKAKDLLAENFKELWTIGMYDELEVAAKKFSNKGGWRKGWLAVRNTKRFDVEKMTPDLIKRLNDLDTILKPTTLIERAKLFIQSESSSALDLVDAIENQGEDTVESIIRSLGSEVALNNDAFKELLSDILRSNGSRLFNFGQGLADGCENPEKVWKDFREQLYLLEESDRNYQVICGFLNAISEIDPQLLDKFLNEAVTDTVLARLFPYLQTSVEITIQGVERLKNSLELGLAPLWTYWRLAYLTINDRTLCELLRLMASNQEGIEVAIEILSRRIHAKENVLSDDIISIGQELLLKFQFTKKSSREDHHLALIINHCFANESAQENSRFLCNNLFQACVKSHIYFTGYDHVLKALATTQPCVFLDVFLGEDIKQNSRVDRITWRNIRDDFNPITHIDDDLVINWCNTNPKTRYLSVASAIIPFQKSENGNMLEWTSLASRITTNSFDPIAILEEFKSNFKPTTWGSSRAEIMKTRLRLISDLKKHEDSNVTHWARKVEKEFENEISSMRKQELEREKDSNERFE
ncbi:hypothetical protein [Risungbinella massiliensis]|uniref:hypothetical protein n=1 Tax=Risungbinella massiliensis TaxID=1329796 RepID=UPI0005CC34BE|nr:hypothetical protein [Risungbinella massiliensis]